MKKLKDEKAQLQKHKVYEKIEALRGRKGKTAELESKIQKEEAKLRDNYYMCLDYEPSPCVNPEMVEWYLNKIFPDNRDPFISTMLKHDNGINRRMMNLERYKEKAVNLLSLEANTYISHATYVHAIRASQRNKDTGKSDSEVVYRGGCKECVVSTRSIIIDLDYRETEYGGMLAEDFYEVMKENGAFDKYGEPSFCVVSSEGAGLQMVYLLEQPYKTYLQDARINRYEKAVKGLIEHYSEYGADPACSDIGHLFRVPCSFNIKAKTWGFLLHWERIKDEEEEIATYPFTSFETRQEHKKEKPPEIAVEGPYGSFALNRCHDLRILAKLRGTAINGCRNPLLFIYASQYGIIYNDVEKIYNALQEINQGFSEPKADKEILYIAQRAAKKLYRYKDETICQLLGITEEEKRQLQVIGHKTSEAERKRKYRSRKYGEPENKLERNQGIIKARHDGQKIKDIAAQFNLSERTIKRILKDAP